MARVFYLDGISGYVYDEMGGQHHMPHFHAYYAEYEAEIYSDGSIKNGTMPPSQLKRIKEWLNGGGAEIIDSKWKELNGR